MAPFPESSQGASFLGFEEVIEVPPGLHGVFDSAGVVALRKADPGDVVGEHGGALEEVHVFGVRSAGELCQGHFEMQRPRLLVKRCLDGVVL